MKKPVSWFNIKKAAAMEKMFVHMESLTGTVKKYINNRAAAAALTAAEKTSAVVANIIAGIVVAAIILPAVILLGFAAAVVLNNHMGSFWLGFMITGLIFIIAAVVIWRFRESIIRIPVMNHMIKQMTPSAKEIEETDETC
ncbi:MAG: phage holin family protein [Bacteroidetes bacterium]|nr:phage holin family protein [Bacteroidota bacterium]